MKCSVFHTFVEMALSVGGKFASYQDLEREVKLFELEKFMNLHK